jgi:hypothetical protein
MVGIGEEGGRPALNAVPRREMVASTPERARDGRSGRCPTARRGPCAVGVIWLLAPHKPIKAWTGEDPTSVSARAVGRGFGGRDLALAVGTLLTLEDERALATWLKAGALADAADAVSTLAAFRELGSVRRLFWAATAAGTAALGLRLAGAID